MAEGIYLTGIEANWYRGRSFRSSWKWAGGGWMGGGGCHATGWGMSYNVRVEGGGGGFPGGGGSGMPHCGHA